MKKVLKPMKLRSLFLFILIVCFGCELQLQPQPQPKPQPKPIDAYRCLITDVKRIAITRPSKSVAKRQVAAYIETELKQIGLPVRTQPFSSGTNIIGIQRGQLPRIFVIGSHYDSVAQTPGADDNASGCAMTLLLARQFRQTKFRHTIHYIFFDSEEIGFRGSSAYTVALARAGIHCDFMVNFDMVGSLRASAIDPEILFSSLFKKYPWARAISYRQEAGAWSDHVSFQKHGIPFVWIFTGDTKTYHTPADTPSTLNYRGMVRINQYAKDLILSFDKQIDQAMIDRLPMYQRRL